MHNHKRNNTFFSKKFIGSAWYNLEGGETASGTVGI